MQLLVYVGNNLDMLKAVGNVCDGVFQVEQVL